MKIQLPIVLLLLMSLQLSGQTLNTNGDWGTAGNWTPSGVPGGTGTDVSINANGTVSSTHTIGHIKVENNRSLTVNSGGSLTLGSQELFNSLTTTSATLTTGPWLAPSGITSATIQAWGGGGAGGAVSGRNSAAGGGAGGAHATINTTSLIGGTVYNVQVGAGGTSAATPTDGTASWFSAGTQANAILLAPGGRSALNVSNNSTAGLGANGSFTTTPVGTATAGGSGSNATTTVSGAGGAGGLSGGAGGGSRSSATTPSANGQVGQVPGGGGSGAITANVNTDYLGGNGGSGTMSITYTAPQRKNLTFVNNNTLTIQSNGRLEIWGDLIIMNNMEFNILGTLIVHGNIIMMNNGEVIITGTGSLEVGGDFTSNNNLTMSNLGNVAINGTLSVGNNSTYAGNGTIKVGNCLPLGSMFCSNIPLPVELLYFRSVVVPQGIQLNWASAKEWDFSHYTLERSANGRDYAPIHVEYVHGDSYTTKHYNYTDHQPQYGANYYRLKATDIDGTEEYKGVVLAYSGTKGNLELMPNPAKGDKVNLRYLGASEGTWVSILNASGLEMIRVEMQEHNMQLPISNLPRGLYIIKVWNQLESRQTRLVIP